MVMAKPEVDYYEVLGVTPDDSCDKIHKEFRKKSKKWHPDTHPGDANAEEMFKKLKEADEILSDKKRRAEYDRYVRPLFTGATATDENPTTTEANINTGLRNLSKAMLQSLGHGMPGSSAIRDWASDLWDCISYLDYLRKDPRATVDSLKISIERRLELIDYIGDTAALKARIEKTPAFATLLPIREALDACAASGISVKPDLIVDFATERLHYALYYVSEITQLNELNAKKEAPGADIPLFERQIREKEAVVGKIFMEVTEGYGIEGVDTPEFVSTLWSKFDICNAVIETLRGTNQEKGGTMPTNDQNPAQPQSMRTAFPIIDINGVPAVILMESRYIDALERYKEQVKGIVAVTQSFPLTGTLNPQKFQFVQTDLVDGFNLSAKEILWSIGKQAKNDFLLSNSAIVAAENLGLKAHKIDKTKLWGKNADIAAKNGITGSKIRSDETLTVQAGSISDSSLIAEKLNVSATGDIKNTTIHAGMEEYFEYQDRAHDWDNNWTRQTDFNSDMTPSILKTAGTIESSDLYKVLPIVLCREESGYELAHLTATKIENLNWLKKLFSGTKGAEERGIAKDGLVIKNPLTGCTLEKCELNAAVMEGFSFTSDELKDSSLYLTIMPGISVIDLSGLNALRSKITITSETDTPKKILLTGALLNKSHLSFVGRGFDVDFFDGSVSDGSVTGTIDTLDFRNGLCGSDNDGSNNTTWGATVGTLKARGLRLGNVTFTAEPPLQEADMPMVRIVGRTEFMQCSENITRLLPLAGNAAGVRPGSLKDIVATDFAVG